jgi:predicted MFS family arabinose efflux permease
MSIEMTDPFDGDPPRWLVVLLAASCGVVVANLYYAQPLLSQLKQSFQIGTVAAGGLVTASQLGYAVGLVLIVPLADRVEKRFLTTTLLVLGTIAVLVEAAAPNYAVLLIAALLGAPVFVVVQVIVAFAADITSDATRGRTVGKIVSGLLTGILLSRALGSMLAQLTSWRAVYLTSAALMFVLTITLQRVLPKHEPSTCDSYGKLIVSTVRMLKIHPALRRRALYQATMFGAFSVFWTAISFVLTSDPFDYNQIQIGIFALVGAGGALIAPRIGRWADLGHERPVTVIAFIVASSAFLIAGFGRHHIVLLGLGAVLLDMAVQATLVSGQQIIFRLDPSARARINSAYIATFFLGGAIGSQASSYAYHRSGWGAVAIVGAVFPALALLYWLSERPQLSIGIGSRHAQ